jgi:hypothetical protein
MFKGIEDMLGVSPFQKRQELPPPPPIILTYCIYKVISFHRIGSPYTDSVQPAWLLCPFLPRSLPTSAHSAPPLRNGQRFFAAAVLHGSVVIHDG